MQEELLFPQVTDEETKTLGDRCQAAKRAGSQDSTPTHALPKFLKLPQLYSTTSRDT